MQPPLPKQEQRWNPVAAPVKARPIFLPAAPPRKSAGPLKPCAQFSERLRAMAQFVFHVLTKFRERFFKTVRHKQRIVAKSPARPA